MATELPEGARKQLDNIRAKLVECLGAAAPDQTEARSEFMRHGVSQGGVVLDAEPAIPHPEYVITKMYKSMFDQAKEEGVELREIVTNFQRVSGGAWRFDTRWITAGEFAMLTESVRPIVEEMRIGLRMLADATRSDWTLISYDVDRVVVVSRDKARTVSEPPAELKTLVARVETMAQAQGLIFTGAEWIVERTMDDVEGELESSIGVI